MLGQVIPAPVGTDDHSLAIWAIVALIAVMVSTWPAVMAWLNARKANRAVNDVENGELRISQRVKDLHESLEWRVAMLSRLVEDTSRILQRVDALERDVAMLVAFQRDFQRRWGGLHPPLDDAVGLEGWAHETDRRIERLEGFHDEPPHEG